MRQKTMSDQVYKEARYHAKARDGMTPEQIVAMFNGFASEYDQDALKAKCCMTASVMANYLEKYFSPVKRSKLTILDVAAGTGALGELLKRAGFVHMDALDPAEKMLEVAKSKNIYQKHFCEYMDGRRIRDLDTDSYDLLTVSDGFNLGLIPLKAFTEMVRVVKPGGHVVFASAHSGLDLGYKGEFFPLMSRLEEEGVWEKVAHLHLEDGMVSYRGSGTGTLFAYRVKVSEMNQSIL